MTQGADLVLGDFLVSYEGPGCGLVTFASGELSPVVSRWAVIGREQVT